MKVAVFVDDLIFRTKISAVARELGATVTFCQSAESVPEDAPLVLMDLEASGFAAVDVIRTLKAHRSTTIVAYVSHVQVELKQRAENAGADAVLPRSAFVERLPELLR